LSLRSKPLTAFLLSLRSKPLTALLFVAPLQTAYQVYPLETSCSPAIKPLGAWPASRLRAMAKPGQRSNFIESSRDLGVTEVASL